MLVNKDKIKDRNGKIVGWIETDHLGNKVVRDFYGKLLGRYIKTSNLTKDFYGRIVAQGDATTGLIYRSLK